MQHGGYGWQPNQKLQYHQYAGPEGSDTEDTSMVAYGDSMQGETWNRREILLWALDLLSVSDEEEGSDYNVPRNMIIVKMKEGGQK